MLIDLAKVFPISCSGNGIDEIVVKSENITKISIADSSGTNDCEVEIGKLKYRFSSVDCVNGSGFDLLSALYAAEKFLMTTQYPDETWQSLPSMKSLEKFCLANIEMLKLKCGYQRAIAQNYN